MFAAVLHEGHSIEIEDVHEQPLEAEEVRVKVMAAGICGSDTHKMRTKWKYGFPAVMGHEFSGEVIEIGSKVTKFSIGERVVGIPLLPCYECEYCLSGEYSLCENYKMIGSHFYGAFAEKVVVPEKNLLNIDDLNYEEATMIEPLAVALHGVQGIDPKLGDTVLVFGAGNIGLLTIQALKIIGVKNIIAVDVKKGNLEEAKKYGADFTINSLVEDLEKLVKEYSGNSGVDIVLECAGSAIAQEQCLRVVKKHGKIAYIGIAYEDIHLPEDSFEKIFRHELTLKGFWNSYSAPFPGKEWTNSYNLIKQNKVNVKDMITHRFPLSQTKEAFEMILEQKELHKKVLIIPNKEM
ncbi:galactitol-1-phosphate 5-dehydrogenase [Marinilactibacillus psychrotolerans]|uniref:galactitol-1-phosphate 5-dehydrogenase n=1 Tax=Marinilactibacillus psychrotolerans TaxID=191770 RepID=UPI0039AECA27